jgi:hypothetical protein
VDLGGIPSQNAVSEARKAAIAGPSGTFQTVSLGNSVNKGKRKGRESDEEPGPEGMVAERAGREALADAWDNAPAL